MSTPDFEIKFKIFENGRILVVMGKSSSLVKQCKNDKTESILQYMFETVVLFAGMTNVLQSATVDRISRHLKVCRCYYFSSKFSITVKFSYYFWFRRAQPQHGLIFYFNNSISMPQGDHRTPSRWLHSTSKLSVCLI